MKRCIAILSAALSFGALLACSGTNQPNGKVPNVTTPATAQDPLAERPQLAPAVPYNAPEPEVYVTREGMTVWLLQRPSLPLVSMSLSLRTGSADDPTGKEGLCHATTSMLDEGAGDRDALALASEIGLLGASLWTGAWLDGSSVSLSVLKKQLDKAFPIFADVVARPRFDAEEWKRVHELWQNQLARRSDSPNAVAAVVTRAVLYGPGTAYGHPSGGQPDSAKRITLEDVKAFYRERWRPDQALLVVAGDITRSELDALMAGSLDNWKNPSSPAPDPIAPPAPLATRPRLVLVDRPDAPQAVIGVVRAGVAANDPNGPLLDLINTALGGSFTSRLNQNLREDHGWSYGARSSFVETRGVGSFIARAAVFTNVTAPALKEMLKEIETMRSGGLTDDELTKVRAQDLTSLIQGNETLAHLASRLSELGVLGLAPSFDAKASARRQTATREQLAALAKQYLDLDGATVIVVGPKDQLIPQLKTLELGDPELWSADGQPLSE